MSSDFIVGSESAKNDLISKPGLQPLYERLIKHEINGSDYKIVIFTSCSKILHWVRKTAHMVRFHEDAYWPNLMSLFTAGSEHY